MYSYKKRKQAVEWYYKLGSIKAVQQLLEYPSKNALKGWIKEFEKNNDLHRITTRRPKYTNDEKKNAVIELCAKESTAKEISQKYNVDRATLYNWKHKMFGDKDVPPMDKSNKLEKKSKCDTNKTLEESYDKYETIREQIRKIFTESMGTYGYRRIHMVLKNNYSIVSEKVIRRIMQEENLVVKFIKRKNIALIWTK